VSSQYGELRPTTSEICWRVWSIPANLNWFRVLAALLHDTLVVGVSQTLRHWTQGATYIRQGGHHLWHWPTFEFNVYIGVKVHLLQYVTLHFSVNVFLNLVTVNKWRVDRNYLCRSLFILEQICWKLFENITVSSFLQRSVVTVTFDPDDSVEFLGQYSFVWVARWCNG